MLLSLLPLRQYCKRALTPDALNVTSYSFIFSYKHNHKAIVTGDSLSGLEDAPSPTESYSGKKNYYNKFRYHALGINQALRKNVTKKLVIIITTILIPIFKMYIVGRSLPPI